MTQFQFDMICKIIESGAPALAPELTESLNSLIVDRNGLAKDNVALKTQLDQILASQECGDEKCSEDCGK